MWIIQVLMQLFLFLHRHYIFKFMCLWCFHKNISFAETDGCKLHQMLEANDVCYTSANIVILTQIQTHYICFYSFIFTSHAGLKGRGCVEESAIVLQMQGDPFANCLHYKRKSDAIQPHYTQPMCNIRYVEAIRMLGNTANMRFVSPPSL